MFRYKNLLKFGQFKINPPGPVPAGLARPEYALNEGKFDYQSCFEGSPKILTEDEISKVRKAAQIAARALRAGLDAVRPGITTEEIDDICQKVILDAGAYPSGIYYMGFPKTSCTSVNEVACHGIPDSRPLEEGDIVNIDVTAWLDGAFGDNSDMACAGEVDPMIARLLATTHESLQAGIDAAKPGKPVSDIGKACDSVAKKNGFAICHEFCGHGIGHAMHVAPPVIHVPNDIAFILQPGMCLTVEPIVMMNPDYSLALWPDGWTAVDATGYPSAQAERQLVITENGNEILTK